jgi:hypothetical protein
MLEGSPGGTIDQAGLYTAGPAIHADFFFKTLK